MKESVQIFNSSQFGEIRTAGTSENPLFCLADVCRAVDLNASQVMKRLDDGVVTIHPIHDSLGRQQQANFVTEDGLYDVILDSRKPEARAFRKWITSEVLPSIRKVGGYMVSTTDMSDDEIMARALTIANDTIRRRDERILALEADVRKKDVMLTEANGQVAELATEISRMKPKVDYCDQILNNKGTVLVTSIAQDYGMSAKAFNKLLRDMKVQHIIGTQWILDSRYLCNGYVQSETIEITHKNGMKSCKLLTKWTQKGRLFLYNLLKDNGILPLIEQ